MKNVFYPFSTKFKTKTESAIQIQVFYLYLISTKKNKTVCDKHLKYLYRESQVLSGMKLTNALILLCLQNIHARQSTE